MKNENRAVFDRTSERCDFAIELPLAPTIKARENEVLVPVVPRSIFGRIALLLLRKLRQRSNRNALLELSDDQLKDIGVSRSQAYADHSQHRRNASHGLERKCL